MKYAKRRWDNTVALLVSRYMPDWMFAALMNARRHTLCGERLTIRKCTNGWALKRGNMTLYSHTAKMTGFGEKYFADKYLKHVGISEGDTVLDVGACIGDTTLCMARKSKTGRVIAVEPHPVNASFIRQNLREHDLQLYEAAVGPKRGRIELHTSTACTGHGIHATGGRRGSMTVSCIPLDFFAKDRSINFAKIDVQGAEVEVLQAGTEFLKRIPKLVVETHYNPRTGRLMAEEVVPILDKCGFDSVIVDDAGVVHCERRRNP